MKSINRVLKTIDGRRYGAYRELRGSCERVDGITIRVVRVQPDPYAPPSVVRIETRVRGPSWGLRHTTAFADWLYRRLFRELRARSKKVGEGYSGFLGVPRPSPVMIKRSGLELHSDGRLVARVWVGLPSRRRRVDSELARNILLEVLPRALKSVLSSIDCCINDLKRHVDAWIEQEYIRKYLREKGFIAFVGDGSVLPRKSGHSQEPDPDAVPFEAPRSLRIEIELPTGRIVSGMGLRRGVTLIMGAAFHGKTTLLNAIAAGIYNHIPGDGRELVVTLRNAFYIATEEGRYVHCVDIEPFIKSLPRAENLKCFTTSNASGATSVLASLQEAIECGAEIVLIDEDTVATNALYHDDRVSSLIPEETVIPISRATKGLKSYGVSIIIASRGSLDLVTASDTVVVMHRYRPIDVATQVRSLKSALIQEFESAYEPPRKRVLARIARVRCRVRARRMAIELADLDYTLNLSHNVQLYEDTQINTLREIVKRLKRFEGKRVVDIAREIELKILNEGFEAVLGEEPGPDLGEVRALDIAFVINRLPSTFVSIVSE